MREAIVHGLKVTEDAQIYVQKNDKWIKMRPYFTTTRKGGNSYWYVRIYRDGKYNIYYLHRLLAEAFIDNPNGYRYAAFRSDNHNDLCLENIYWAYCPEKPKVRIPCRFCGKDSMNGICGACNAAKKRKMKSAQKKDTRLNLLEVERRKVENLDYIFSSDKEKEVYEEYLSGKSAADIARSRGVTRQYISKIINRVKNKADAPQNCKRLYRSNKTREFKDIAKIWTIEDLKELGITPDYIREMKEKLHIKTRILIRDIGVSHNYYYMAMRDFDNANPHLVINIVEYLESRCREQNV